MGIVWFILILGAIILVHEFGHFIFSKLFRVYVYEFSLGMGPKLLHYKKKGGETEYCLRLIPIGGFVSLAGEDADDNSKIPNDRKLYNKPVWQRFIIMVAGATMNFVFAFVLLFIMTGIYGTPNQEAVIGSLMEDSPAEKAGINVGDTIVLINNQEVSKWNEISTHIQNSNGEIMEIMLKDKHGNLREVELRAIEDKNKQFKIGIGQERIKLDFISIVLHTGKEMINLFKIMILTLSQLFTGKVGINDLSGPVGIYTIVNDQAKQGFENLIYLTAYLSVNVGVINLLPFPAFDGGRVLFLIIEKIRRKPIPAKTEAIVNTIGFCLLMLLMIVVTIGDIIKLF